MQEDGQSKQRRQNKDCYNKKKLKYMAGMGKRMREMLAAGGSVFALYVFFFISGIGCPIKFLTGISCMGCGMTRAWRQLLQFHIREAFAYHPLVLVPIPAAFLFLFQEKFYETKRKKSCYQWMVAVMIMAFAVVYAIRLLQTGDDIVVFRPKQGFIYKLLRIILAVCMKM